MTILPAPAPGLRACVVVPARDEEALVGACVRALATQEGVERDAYELLLVLDRCTDATEARARAAAGGLTLHVLHAAAPGVGAARRLGMDLACERLHAVGRPDGLIACTDADSEAAPDWLAAQLAAVAAGARAIGGRAALSDAEQEALGPEIRARREREAAARLERAREQAAPGARTEHWQFSGASMALTADSYRLAGPLEPRTGLEDEGLERLLRRHGVPIDRLLGVRVTTSGAARRPRPARARRGPAPRPLARGPPLRRRRLPRRASWPSARRRRSASCSPRARSRPRSAACSTRSRRSSAPALVDEVLVVDAASRDGTARIAAARGARVADESRAAARVRARARQGRRDVARRLARPPATSSPSSTPTPRTSTRASRSACSAR